jgi:hypothetical protein
MNIIGYHKLSRNGHLKALSHNRVHAITHKNMDKFNNQVSLASFNSSKNDLCFLFSEILCSFLGVGRDKAIKVQAISTKNQIINGINI